ncbi:hypothetical protein AMTRI_Chr13g122830 [Amborella trichopoda]
MNPSFSPFTGRRFKSFFPSLFRKLHLPHFLSFGSRKKHSCFSSGSGNKNNRSFLSDSGNNFPSDLSDSCSSNLSGQIPFSIEESAQDSCSSHHSGKTHYSSEESAKDFCSSDHSGQTHLVQESSQDSCSGNLSGQTHFSMDQSVQDYCSGNISGNIHFSVDDSDHDSCNDYYWVSSPNTVFGVLQLMNLRAMHPKVNGADHFESEQPHSTRKMMDLTTIRPLEPPQVDSVESYTNIFLSCMESSPSPSSQTLPRSLLLFFFYLFSPSRLGRFLVLFSFLGIFLGHFFLQIIGVFVFVFDYLFSFFSREVGFEPSDLKVALFEKNEEAIISNMVA